METNELLSAIATLKAKRDELQKQVVSLGESIAFLESSFGMTPTKTTHVQSSNYDTKWGYTKKVLYLLKEKKRFLHFRQLAHMILELDGKKDDTKSVSDLASTLSSACQSIKKDGTIVKIQVGTSNQSVFWGSPKWLDDNGNVKKEHDIVEDYFENPDKSQGKFEL